MNWANQTTIPEFVWRHSGRPRKPTSGESALRLGFEAGRLATQCRHITAQPVLVAPHMRSVAQIECRQLPGWLAPVSVASLNCGVIRFLQQASSITVCRNVHSNQRHNTDRQTDALLSHNSAYLSILSPLSCLCVVQFNSHTKILLLRHSSTSTHAIQIAPHAPHRTTHSHYTGMVIICTTCCNILPTRRRLANSLTMTTSAECSRNGDVTYVSLKPLSVASRWSDAH